MKKCWSCGNETEDDKKFCGKCGAKLIAKSCPSCSHENKPNAKFCASCGFNFENIKPQKTEIKLNSASPKIPKSIFIILGLIVVLSIILVSYQYLSDRNYFSAQNENISTNKIETNKINNESTQPSNKSTQSLKQNYKIGDVIEFGNYYQNDLSNRTPIKWQVLDIQQGKALLISELLLDAQPYNKDRKEITWENSSIRHWLNNEFINESFNSQEKSRISLTLPDNWDNPKYGTNAGNDTKDKVFLLSLDEVYKYLPNANQRAIKVTKYAKKRGAWVCEFDDCRKDGFYGNGFWWLRSPGFSRSYAAYVDDYGSIDDYGISVYGSNGAVRPALWINLQNSNFNSESTQQSIVNIEETVKNSKDNVYVENDKNQKIEETIDLRKGKYASDEYYSTLDKYRYDKNDFDGSISKLINLSEADGTGVPEYLIAKLYHNADKGKKNIEKAMYYYDLSAQKGNGLAMFRLGLLYKANKKNTEAYSYLTDSVNLNVPVATNYLGYMYETGNLVNQDFEKARKLYEQARDLEFYPSSYALANLYLNGLGVSRNNQQACQYLKEAMDKAVNKSSDLYYEKCENSKNTNQNDSFRLIPNVWVKGFGQGWWIYTIQNENLTLRLSCNVGNSDENGKMVDHDLDIELNNKELKLDPKNSLAFLIDGEQAMFSFQDNGYHVSTDWRNGANSWNEFIELLSKGKHIEIYYNSKSIGVINPKGNVKKTLEDMVSFCEAIFYKEQM